MITGHLVKYEITYQTIKENDMNLMEFLKALSTDELCWNNYDIKKWIKELFQLQAKLEIAEEDVARVQQNYKNRCEITEQLQDRIEQLEKVAANLNKRLRKCKNVYRDVTYKHQQVLAKNKILQKRLE